MKKILSGSFVVLFLFLTGCFESNIEDMLIGTWGASYYVSPSEAAKMSEEPLPQGMSMEMTWVGTETYHVGGKLNSVGQFTIRLTIDGQERPLKFLVKSAGSWELQGDVLVETIGNFVVTPMDQVTEEIVRQAPIFQSMITPVAGESVSVKVVQISETTAELKCLAPPYINFTMRKKNNK